MVTRVAKRKTLEEAQQLLSALKKKERRRRMNPKIHYAYTFSIYPLARGGYSIHKHKLKIKLARKRRIPKIKADPVDIQLWEQYHRKW